MVSTSFPCTNGTLQSRQLFFLQQRLSTATYCQSHLVHLSRLYLHPSPALIFSIPIFGTFPCTQLSLESESNIAPERNRPGASILSSRIDEMWRRWTVFWPFFWRIDRATNVHLFSFSKSSMPTDLPTMGLKKNNQKRLGIHSKKVYPIDMDFEAKFILSCGKRGCECELRMPCWSSALSSSDLP